MIRPSSQSSVRPRLWTWPRLLHRGLIAGGLVVGLLFACLDLRSRSGIDSIGGWDDELVGDPPQLQRTGFAIYTGDGVLAIDWSRTLYDPRTDSRPYRTSEWGDTVGWQRRPPTGHGVGIPSSTMFGDWLGRIGFSLAAWQPPGIGLTSKHAIATVPLWFCWMLAFLPAVLALCAWSRRRDASGRGFEVTDSTEVIAPHAGSGAPPAG